MVKLQCDSVLRPLFRHLLDEKNYTLISKAMNDAPKIEAIPIDWIRHYMHKLDLVDQPILENMIDRYLEDTK